jgi:hypothetical protein
LAYLRRGETVNFKLSDDDLKGGVPAHRSQVKNRKPFWYSLQTKSVSKARIVFPEHIDRRYVFTYIPADDDSVVIDKLYTCEPFDEHSAALIHASLNTLFSWYQVELRGRSQLGEGILELKKPDFAGVYVLDPSAVRLTQGREILKAFADLLNTGAGPSLGELGTAERRAFDLAYLRACGFTAPDRMLQQLEQRLRDLAGERAERRLSVADAKVSRRKITNVAAVIDAYAARLAASVEPHPDPRDFIPEHAERESIPILGPVDGALEIGVELFNQGEVYAGETCVARTGSIRAAQFVRGVLLVQPDLTQVDVPSGGALQAPIEAWNNESKVWQKRFAQAASRLLKGIDDARTRQAVEDRALRLLHAK